MSSGASSPDTVTQASDAATCAAMTTMVGASAAAAESCRRCAGARRRAAPYRRSAARAAQTRCGRDKEAPFLAAQRLRETRAELQETTAAGAVCAHAGRCAGGAEARAQEARAQRDDGRREESCGESGEPMRAGRSPWRPRRPAAAGTPRAESARCRRWRCAWREGSMAAICSASRNAPPMKAAHSCAIGRARRGSHHRKRPMATATPPDGADQRQREQRRVHGEPGGAVENGAHVGDRKDQKRHRPEGAGGDRGQPRGQDQATRHGRGKQEVQAAALLQDARRAQQALRRHPGEDADYRDRGGGQPAGAALELQPDEPKGDRPRQKVQGDDAGEAGRPCRAGDSRPNISRKRRQLSVRSCATSHGSDADLSLMRPRRPCP